MSTRALLVSPPVLLAAVLLTTAPAPASAQSLANLSVTPAASSCAQPVDVIVALTEPARPGGLVVPLESSVQAVAPVPPNMRIGSGATTGVVRFRCVPARQATTVTISAGSGIARKSASLSVAAALRDGGVRSLTDGTSNTLIVGETPSRTDGTSNTITVGTTVTASLPTLNGLSLTSSEVVGGLSVFARLSATAGATGVTVSVFPNRAQAVTLPTTVVFAPGETTKTIVINTRPQAVPLLVEIIAADSRTPELRKIAKFTVRPPRVRSIALASTSVVTGQPVVGTLTLDGPAPEGFTVRLASNSTIVPMPAPITVQAGATVVSFSLPTIGSSAGAIVTLTATAAGDATTGGIVTAVKITP